MKHFLLGTGLLAFSVGAVAQTADRPKPMKSPKPTITSNAPVTGSEARAVFIRMESVMRTVLKMNASSPAASHSGAVSRSGVASKSGAVSISGGSQPVRRDQIVAEMTRQYDLIRPKVKFTPKAVPFDSGVLNMHPPKQKANLEMLIRLGAIAKVGPLATNRTDTITVPEFGDAVGFFMSRMAEITHQPSSKWSPWLRDQGE